MSKKPKIIRPFIVTKDPMVQSLLHKFAKRSEDGILKYKKTMAQANKLVEGQGCKVVFRKGEDVRCMHYCRVNEFCDHYMNVKF